MRRVTCIVLTALILVSCNAFSLAEEDISLTDISDLVEDDQINPEGTITDSSLGDEVVTEENYVMPDGSVTITITCTGDVTIGGDVRKNSTSIFDKELEKQEGDLGFPFRNVRDIFAEDDMTLVNFEGTLTEAPTNPKKQENSFLFSAPPSYVETLIKGNIEAVSLENNHVMDHGDDGYKETISTLNNAGIVYSNANEIGVYTAKGVDIAMLSYQTFNGLYPHLFEQVPLDVKAAKEKYPIVITSFHWGAELDYKPNDNQQKLAKIAIDAGADLVIGHHSHRINPIEEYKGKYICYSLGNCSFAGNTKPSDMSTFIFQTKFRVLDGVAEPKGFIIIPSRISSHKEYNDFAITPYTKEVNIESLINTLKKNGKSLDNPVSAYPISW